MIKKFVQWKTYMRRSMTYVSMANSAMILVIFLKQFNVSITKWGLPITIITILVLIFMGWIEDILGIHDAENLFNQNRAPYDVEMVTKIRNIERLVKK